MDLLGPPMTLGPAPCMRVVSVVRPQRVVQVPLGTSRQKIEDFLQAELTGSTNVSEQLPWKSSSRGTASLLVSAHCRQLWQVLFRAHMSFSNLVDVRCPEQARFTVRECPCTRSAGCQLSSWRLCCWKMFQPLVHLRLIHECFQHLCLCVSVSLSVSLALSVSLCLCESLHVSLSVFLSLSFSFSPFLCVSMSLSPCLSVSLSISSFPEAHP